MLSGLFPFLFFMSKTIRAIPYSKKEERGTRKTPARVLDRVKHQPRKGLYVQEDSIDD